MFCANLENKVNENKYSCLINGFIWLFVFGRADILPGSAAGW
jgi:hypothetical protein